MISEAIRRVGHDVSDCRTYHTRSCGQRYIMCTRTVNTLHDTSALRISQVQRLDTLYAYLSKQNPTYGMNRGTPSILVA